MRFLYYTFVDLGFVEVRLALSEVKTVRDVQAQKNGKCGKFLRVMTFLDVRDKLPASLSGASTSVRAW